MKKEWKKVANNCILQGKDFFISYNPNTGKGHMNGLLTDMGNALGNPIGVSFKDGEETAVKGKKGEWMILEGDFRKEYLAAFPSYDKVVAVYKKHKAKHNSSWSTV